MTDNVKAFLALCGLGVFAVALVMLAGSVVGDFIKRRLQ